MDSEQINQKNIRNIAIIAHVDHGKTTLVDAFLKQNHVFRDNQEEMQQEQILDSGDLEREKGITIKAKNISIRYKDYKINIIDTPGHADFGGEVERTLSMAEGCLLLVDAQEGPMPQTRFVLKKAMELGLKTIVVINKIDKKFANAPKVVDKLNDLFLNLATQDEQLDFPLFYAIAREGKVFTEIPEGDLTVPDSTKGDLSPLMEKIVEYFPHPIGDETGPLQMQVSSLEYNTHLGRLLIGKIKRGKARIGDNIVVIHNQEEDSKKEAGTIKNMFVREGLEFVESKEAKAGEIVAISGVDSTAIGGTLCISSHLEPLPVIKISNPSVQIKFEANTSPLAGKEGKFVTAKQIQARLEKEIESNISLKITKADGGSYFVAGRGELQLSILIETMRREGYEFQIRKPEVLFTEVNGVKSEPLEELVIDVPEEYHGVVNAALNARKAELVEMEKDDFSKQVKFIYKILTRKLLGLRAELLTATKGHVVMNNFLIDYVPYTNIPEMYREGVMIASDPGVAMGYALNSTQERGQLFIGPGTQVYTGMIVGVNKYEEDMEVNVTKERQKSGFRIKHDEITQTALNSIKAVTLDFALFFINKDEMLEVTPQSLRLRKTYLTKTQREWSKRKNLTDLAKKQMGITY